MEAIASDLVNQCKNTESKIEKEKQRLQTAKQMLEHYKTNQELINERENNQKREEDIKRYRDKVKALKVEFEMLRNAIAEIEKERTDVNGPDVEKKKRSLNVMAAEIDTWNCEIGKLERKIQKMKNVNTRMEEENRKKLEEHRVNGNFLIEKNSSGSFQLGRLRMKEEEVKLILDSVKKNLKRTLDGINTLQNDLKEVESQCMYQESHTEMKEHENLLLLDTILTEKASDCNTLECRIEKSVSNLNNLRKSFEERKPVPDVKAVVERNAVGEKEIKDHKMKIEELRLEFGILHGALVKIKRDKVDIFESLTKKRDLAMRKINSDTYQVKEEIASVDDKIKKVKKVNKWIKDNYNKKLLELSDSLPFDQRELTGFRILEDEAKKTVEGQKKNLRKLKEQIIHLRTSLKDVESRCTAEEQKVEDITTALKELKKVYETAIAEEIRMGNIGLSS